jgi:hypothetical protein
VKRTLKRESKVLEIVRREAIGTGGSLIFTLGCSMMPPSEGPAGTGSVSKAPSSRVHLLARVMHSVWGASQHRLRESGDRWASGRAWRAGLTAVSHQRDLVIPVTAGAEESITTHVRKGEALCRHGGLTCGDREPMLVRRGLSSVAQVAIYGGLVDAGGTVLIDPS